MLVWYLYKEILHVVLESAHALEVIKSFMQIIQEEVLSQNEHALGISLQIADIHVEEMHWCFIEFDTFKLKQAEIEAMLEAFLHTL